jgi:hypothetical protein
LPQKLSYECFHPSFRKTKTGEIGAILENLFIWTRIRGKMMSLTASADKPSTHHQGRPTSEFAQRMLSLIDVMKGSKGWKMYGI